MSEKTYVIRHKVTRIKPTEIPKSTYVAETFVPKPNLPPILADARFESLSQPKIDKYSEDSPPPIPKYQNPPPEFEPVDVRANASNLLRDAHLKASLSARLAEAKANEPTEFLEWQSRMRKEDEDTRQRVVEQRHADLDQCRRRAMKAKKEAISKRLEIGRSIRVETNEDFCCLQKEIDEERQAIRDLKAQLHDRSPAAVERIARSRIESTKAMKRQLRQELREAAKLRSEEERRIKEKAAKIRESAANHDDHRVDAYLSKVEITETKFLSALSDEETTALLNCHSDDGKQRIERLIEEHRRSKEAKMDKMVALLDDLTKSRSAEEAEHVEERKKKADESALADAKRKAEEEAKIIKLAVKLEKKRQNRIQEAKDMEEHTRQIAARNRYLALNKKSLAAKTFQSQQDAKLRSAKERQTSLLSNPDEKCESKRTKKPMDMTNLDALLGI